MANFTFTNVRISGMASAMPTASVKPESFDFKTGNAEDFTDRTGIDTSYRAVDLQTTSDLGFVAADNLLTSKNIDRDEIGVILFISKTSDYRSPATAIVLQKRLGVPKDCIGYDINMAGSAFVHGLQVAASLLSGLNKKYALIVSGDTPSKQFAAADENALRFSDAASAILLENGAEASIKLSVFADGSSFKSFMMPGGGFRNNNLEDQLWGGDASYTKDNLFIDIDAVKSLVSDKVAPAAKSFLEKNGASAADYDVIALQQFGTDVTEKLVEAVGTSGEKVAYGNTAGSSTPLYVAEKVAGQDKDFHVLSCVFGEGFSWGFADFYINGKDVLPTVNSDDYYTEGAVTHEM